MLAEKLGMTVETMLDSMTNAEYLHWRAYYVWLTAHIDFLANKKK